MTRRTFEWNGTYRARRTHARFADNRITTSGRSEIVTVATTVWVGRRRGAATTNDTNPAALKQLAEEAVQEPSRYFHGSNVGADSCRITTTASK